MIWQAFHRLRASRGMSGRIPFSEIARYSDWLGIADPVQRSRLVDVVMALDKADTNVGRTAPNA